MSLRYPNEPKIYLLPNLMTAGNLFCGFAATLRIIEASALVAAGHAPGTLYHEAIAFILACSVLPVPEAWHEAIAARQPAESSVAIAGVYTTCIDADFIKGELQ